jgi:hypothetical protein
MTDKPADPPADPKPADEGLKTRVDGLEAEQQRQGGVLDEIRQLLTGGTGKPGPGNGPDRKDPLAGPDPGSVAEQMRQAVRDVRAEEAAADHDAHHAQLKAPPPEVKPDEVMIRGKARAQKFLFGSDPK